MKTTRRRRLALALSGSLLLHAGGLIVLELSLRRSRVRPPAAPPSVQRTIVVELRAPAKSKEARPGSEPVETRRLPGATAKRVAPPARTGIGTGPSAPGIAGEFSRSGKDPARRASAGQNGLSLQLDPGLLLGGSPGQGEGPPGPVRVPSREEALAQERTEVKARIDGWVQSEAARIRARAPDAYWQTVQDKLSKDFKVDWEVLDGAKAGSPAARAAGEAARGWQRAAEAYGRTGSPMVRSPGGAQVPPEDRGFRGDPSLTSPLYPLFALGAGRPGEGLFHHTLIAWVMITQDEDGRVLDVRLEAGSGNGSYDRLALEHARGLLEGTLGVPPKDHRRSLWAFESEFTQVPPFPILGCALDSWLIPRDCYYPLKKMVQTRLRLEAVY